MAPRAAPHSGCPGRPALPCPTLPLPCLSPAPQGTGSDWKNLPGTAQFLSTQTDTMFAFIYKMVPCPTHHTYVVQGCRTKDSIFQNFHALSQSLDPTFLYSNGTM
jgi:hypothetical protein